MSIVNPWIALDELNSCIDAYDLAMAVGDTESAISIAEEVFMRWAALDIWMSRNGYKLAGEEGRWILIEH